MLPVGLGELMLPQGIARVAGRLVRCFPDAFHRAVLPAKYSYEAGDMTVAVPPPTPIRLFVGPVNFGGQGTAWARAAENNLYDVGAVSMAYTGIGEFGFPVDQPVPATGYVLSKRWQRAQAAAVAEGFTHVLIEAERRLFGRVFDQSVQEQIRILREAGVKVAMLAHGTDLRLPSRHALAEEFSPFRDGEWHLTPKLERDAAENRAILDEVGAPVFVSTLGLLEDAPGGSEWLPVVVDSQRWTLGPPPLERSRPVVVHAPSNGMVKGSALIDPQMQRLHDAGLIEYRRVSGVSADAMPQIYQNADIVLDQFRLGDYGVAACEAMLTGRITVGHVSASVRDEVLARTGRELPIVEATPSTIEDVVKALVMDREEGPKRAEEGRAFAEAIHNGRFSAAILAPFLGADLRG